MSTYKLEASAIPTNKPMVRSDQQDVVYKTEREKFTAVRKEILVGTVKPFGLDRVEAESNRIAGRRVTVDFSKALALEITPETISRWISISPAPKDLKAEIQDKVVTLKGAFELGTRYRVAIKAGVPALQPFKLEQAQTREVVFKEIAPRFATRARAGDGRPRGSGCIAARRVSGRSAASAW